MQLDRVIAVRNNKTIYRDGDRCVKVFGQGYAKADVLAEALNQARAEQTGLAVPEVLDITRLDGRWAIVSTFIPGPTLAEQMQAGPNARETAIELLVELQMQTHAKECPLFYRLFDKLHRKLSLAELDEARRTELHDRLDGMPRHVKLCHGDFLPENIILSRDGRAYLLDWAHAARGNASADVAETYLSLLLTGDTALAEAYLLRFCVASATDRSYVRRWIPIIAAARSLRAHGAERERLLAIACGK